MVKILINVKVELAVGGGEMTLLLRVLKRQLESQRAL